MNLSKKVTLSKVEDTPYEDERKGVLPPQVRVKKYVSTFVALDSINEEENSFGKGPADVLFKTDISIRNVKRIGVSYFSMNYNVPNVNPENSVCTFRESTDGGLTLGPEITIVFPEGFYTTGTQLIDELIVLMNASSGLLTYDVLVPSPVQSDKTFVIGIVAPLAGDVFTFTQTGSMNVYGASLINLPKSLTTPPTAVDFSAQKIIGSVNLQYTKYVDVVSRKLTYFSTNDNTSNSTFNANLLYRIYLDEAVQPRQITSHQHVVRYMNYNVTNEIFDIDIGLLDQFGNLLYVPTLADNTNSGFSFSLTLEIQN